MAEQLRVRKPTSSRRDDAPSSTPDLQEGVRKVRETGKRIKENIDAVVGEVDNILEEAVRKGKDTKEEDIEAAIDKFVKGYIQRGGE